MCDRTHSAMYTENPGHETDHQETHHELGPGQCHHYIHKPNPVYQKVIGGEHNPGKLSARIPDHLRYSPMGAPVVGVPRLTIKLDRLMIVSNQAFSAGFCMYD